MNKARGRLIAGNEISDISVFSLGGYRQKVLIEGKSRDLPIVVTLHGGPGTPIPFSVGCRGLFPEFTDRFLMVYWDQLGCGINNYVIDNDFRIENFVQMTVDLLRELRKLFPKNRIHVFATSWGSVLSARALEEARELVDGVVVCGQLVKEVFLSREVLETLEGAAVPGKKLERIRGIRPENLLPRDLQLISSCIRKYTDGYVNKQGAKAAVGPIVRGLLTSPDYRFRDFKAIVMNGYRKNVTLWKELLSLDLSETLKNVKVPYKILQGDTDIVASTKNVKELAEAARNPYLQYRVIENTGHMPGADMMEQVLEELEAQAYSGRHLDSNGA